MKTLIPILVALLGLTASGQDDVADVPSAKLRVGEDANKTCFLIGPKQKSTSPKNGYKLLVVLPGGDGSDAFQPFIKRMVKHGLPDGYLAVQLVAVKWTPKQQIVWPHASNKVPGMKFGTDDFVEAVITEVKKKFKIDTRHIFTLSWSSSGPAAYATSLQEKTAVTGSYITMSVFKPKFLPPVSRAKGRAYYIEHAPDDRVCPFRMADQARKDLTAAGAQVAFSKYNGGHGWRGNIYGRIRKAIQWLEEKTK